VLSHVRNRGQYVSAKKEIVAIAHQAQKKLRGRKVNLDELVYSVQLYYDPHEKTVATGVLPQPYQCALQLIDAGKKLGRRDTVHFVKVKPFNYKGRTFTVKPVDQVKGLVEVNVEDYLRNLTTALEQTFKPMEIELKEYTETKLTGWFEV
jgi:DNA polymerase elongation subunit (family B)